MSLRRRGVLTAPSRRSVPLVVSLAALLLGVPLAMPARAADVVQPGMQTYTAHPDGGGQCTANFVFTDDAGVTYLGQAAHCAAPDDTLPTETNGCDSRSLPLGTEVEDVNGDRLGVLVYSSWLTMQRVNERDGETCDYNDFALVRLDPARATNVQPTMPFWGGPVGLATTLDVDETVYTYGDSSLRFGIQHPERGLNIENSPTSWSHVVCWDLPTRLPGDSGSGVLDSQGFAVGVLVTISVNLCSGVTDLARAMGYVSVHEAATLAGLQVVTGGPFTP